MNNLSKDTAHKQLICTLEKGEGRTKRCVDLSTQEFKEFLANLNFGKRRYTFVTLVPETNYAKALIVKEMDWGYSTSLHKDAETQDTGNRLLLASLDDTVAFLQRNGVNRAEILSVV